MIRINNLLRCISLKVKYVLWFWAYFIWCEKGQNGSFGHKGCEHLSWSDSSPNNKSDMIYLASCSYKLKLQYCFSIDITICNSQELSLKLTRQQSSEHAICGVKFIHNRVQVYDSHVFLRPVTVSISNQFKPFVHNKWLHLKSFKKKFKKKTI